MAKKKRSKDIIKLNKERARQNNKTRGESNNAKSIVENKTENTEKIEKAVDKGAAARSRAKAFGVKSAFIVGSDVVMTSFGKGNDAVVEKRIENGSVKNINDKHSFDISEIQNDGKKFCIESPRFKGKSAVADNPAFMSKGKKSKDKNGEPIESKAKPAGTDLLHRKDVLEERYFGKTFDDNIHIQLIYNILDIEKILASHSNNIVFALNNMMGIDTDEDDDFVGCLSTKYVYDEFGNAKEGAKAADVKKLEHRKKTLKEYAENEKLGYYGSAFYKTNKEPKSEKEIYDILALMGSLRQVCAHEDSRSLEQGWLYNLEDMLDDEFKAVLDSVYSEAVENVNKDFTDINKVNLNIIYDIFESMGRKADIREITRDYYSFIVSKKYKNIGFSIKKIRERVTELPAGSYLKDQEYDSVRSKLNKIIDFVIYSNYIHNEPNKIEENNNTLRASLNEADKEEFYKNEALSIWNRYLKEAAKITVSKLSGDEIEKQGKSERFKEIELDGEYKIGTGVGYFCKLIYMAALFLDGKEINDLLTTLINKFDNIGSYIKTLDELGLESRFADKYKLFEQSSRIVDDLRDINSFARMQKPLEKTENAMFKDALEILGVTEEAEDAEMHNLYYNEDGTKRGKGQKGLRNFIINNVIKSSRFKYLVRYSNAKKIRSLAENKNVVKFALTKISDSQLQRYFESCGGDRDVLDKNTWIKKLTDIIANIDYNEFKNVKQNAKSKWDKDEKAEMQTVISLYLTILYQITKNLVYVNSRYVMALHALERDMELYKDCDNRLDKGLKNSNCFIITEKFIDEGYLNRRASEYIAENMKKADGSVFIGYRNKIAHLAVIRNINKYVGEVSEFGSYFQLYHYVMQRYLSEDVKINKTLNELDNTDSEKAEAIRKYFENAKAYKSYSKDLVKALNVPFGYNLARYKNLSIEQLFDKNDDRNKNKDNRN